MTKERNDGLIVRQLRNGGFIMISEYDEEIMKNPPETYSSSYKALIENIRDFFNPREEDDDQRLLAPKKEPSA